MNRKTESRINLAVRAAKSVSNNQKYKIGCVIFKGNTPISLGVNNMSKTHPRASSYRTQTIHAELAALIGVDFKDLLKSTAYVARVGKKGDLRIARPCSICENLLQEYGLRGVWYTTSDRKIKHLSL